MSKILKIFFLIVLLLLIVFSIKFIVSKKVNTWTLAFYFAGDNSLENEMVKDLKNIAKYYKNYKDVNVVVFFDRNNDMSRDNFFTTWMGARVFHVNKPYKELLRESFVVPFLDSPWGTEVMSTTSDTVNQFFSFVKDNFRSERYAFFITGHGNGWFYGEERFMDKKHPFSKEYSLDMNSISIKKGLINNYADLLVLDICLMGDLETVNLLSDSARCLVVNQTTIPAEGLDYDDIMKRFTENQNMSARKLAYEVVESYSQTYKDSSFHFATTAIEFNKRYFDFMKEFTEKVSSKENQDMVRGIAERSTRVNAWTEVSPEMIDMGLLREELGLGKYFEKAPKGFVINQFSKNTSLTGLSVFYPKINNKQMIEDYDKLNALPFWNELIKKGSTETTPFFLNY
jgi:hypothetical protein